MFYKVFQPHPALREFVNNIMVFQLDIPLHEKPPTISFPPLAEQCLYFYPFEVPESEYLTSHEKSNSSTKYSGWTTSKSD